MLPNPKILKFYSKIVDFSSFDGGINFRVVDTHVIIHLTYTGKKPALPNSLAGLPNVAVEESIDYDSDFSQLDSFQPGDQLYTNDTR